MKRILLPIFLLASYFVGTSSLTFADENFTTSHSVTYFISEDGQTQVTQNISITNQTATQYISDYTLTIGSESISEVSASDPSGLITPEVTKENGQTTIKIKIAVKVVGRGKVLNIQTRYLYPEVIRKRGTVWEAILPSTSGLEKMNSYHLEISVPASFGDLIYSSPLPKEVKDQEGRTILTYEKEQLLKGVPRAAFGTFQLFKLRLTYHLENPNLWQGFTEIALPPDIPGYQKVILLNISPVPSQIRVDEDQNYLARYNLGSREKKDVIWEGYVVLFYPSRNFGSQKASEIPPELINRYTKPQKYWEVDNIEIKSAMEKLIDPQLSVFENVSEIYKFVVTILSYNKEKLSSPSFSRLGAVAALSTPRQAVCMEYTDLFITLSRAAGIPAREVDGFAYTEESQRPLSFATSGRDVLHTWPQVFIPGNGWVMVDPTWGSTAKSDYFTAFDLSHIAFVVKGISSEYPLPAGSYKTSPTQKDVEVALSTETQITEEKEVVSLEINFPESWIDPLPISGELIIRNKGKTAVFGGAANLSPGNLVSKETNFSFPPLPPLGEIRIPLNLKFTDILPYWDRQKEHGVAITLNFKTFEGEEIQLSSADVIVVRPIFFPFTFKSLVGTFLILALFGISVRKLLSQLLRK